MILCDNIIFELQSVGGVSKYWSQTISHIDKSGLKVAFLEGDSVSKNRFRRELKLSNRIIREQGSPGFRRLKKPSIECDIFHSSYYRISRHARSNVVTIHDFMNEKYPTGYRDRLLSYIKKQACKHAKAIAVVSERTRKDLFEHFPFIDPGIVAVTYNGIDLDFYPDTVNSSFEAGPYSLFPRGFFLYVGTRGYCKNFPYVLKFVSEAHAQGLTLPLIIVGGGKLTKSEQSMALEFGLAGSHLKPLDGMSKEILRKLYSNCLALLIPSIYEGFGLPAAEAARCGALVLTARGSALDEIVGDSEYAFELDRKNEIARVLSLGLDSALANEERNRVTARSQMFTWESSAQQLLEIYNEL